MDMEYTVKQLAKISGVTPRTLRYYDQIGLLAPDRVEKNGYRMYGQEQVDLLQQILFFRELGVDLETIRSLVYSGDFDREKALEDHLQALLREKTRVEVLIGNIRKTLSSMKGEKEMKNEEKFRGFQKKYLEENEKKYGREIREKYGDDTVDAVNRKAADMTEAQWKNQEALAGEILDQLGEAVKTGEPGGRLAQQVCQLHREWLCLFWPEGMYTKEAHRSMGEMYAADERFRAYYDQAGKGAAEFLRDALNIFCSV